MSCIAIILFLARTCLAFETSENAVQGYLSAFDAAEKTAFCGGTLLRADDCIAALAGTRFNATGPNRTRKQVCFNNVFITGPKKSEVIEIRDLCLECGHDDVSVPRPIFETLTGQRDGRVLVKWSMW